MKKNNLILLLTTLFLLVLGTTSLGATSYNQINEVLNSYGYGDMPVNSDVTSALSQNCAVFFTNYNTNNEPTRVTIMYNKYGFFPVYLQKQGSGTSTYYRIYASSNTGWLYFHYYDINTSTKELTYGGSQGTGNYPRMTSYSNYSSNIGIDEFNTYAFQKKVLGNSLIYLPSDQGLAFNSTTGQDIYYVWDGKWNGTQNGTAMDIYGGSFTFAGQYLYYYYESGLDEPIDLTIEMNSYYPASLKNLSESTMPENNGDKYDLIYAGTKHGYSYYYVRLYDLVEKCRNGMISRMTATASDINESGEFSNVVMCTSEFFGINKWISNSYKVRNLLDYINIQDDTIYPEDETPSTGSGDSIHIIVNGGLNSGDIAGLNGAIGNLNTTINNLNQNLPNSGDITNSVVDGNKDFWGNSDNMNAEDYENILQTEVNISMNSFSGELSKNEIFKSIAIAEQKVIDLFLGTPTDFLIEWQDVYYMDTKLIPAGQINFSKFCRENEALGRVKNTLNIIVSALISFALFKYIFNLIMVTLGIDHPLVLENQKDDITEISTTKIGNKTYVTKKTYKSNERGK